MLKMVIFDFDLTLFDSSSIKPLMDNRQWSLVYKNIPDCKFYANALNLIELLKLCNIKVIIVSNSPRSHVERVLKYYNTTVDYIVCYHDVKNHKPNPDCVFLSLNKFNILNNEALYIGDNDIDRITAQNAKLKFYGVEWGTFSQKVRTLDYGKFIKYINSKKK